MVAFPKGRGQQNPYAALVYGCFEPAGRFEIVEFTIGRALFGRYDIFHLHWLEMFIVRSATSTIARLLLLGLLLVRFAARNTKLVWTVHNLSPHDNYHPRLYRFAARLVARRTDLWITMTRRGVPAICSSFPALAGKSSAYIPHPHYVGQYGASIGQSAARRRLGLPMDAKVLLYFGTVKAYKNVLLLARHFVQLSDPGMYLIVAGHAEDAAVIAELESLAVRDGRIRLHIGFVPDDLVPVLFGAADLVVLPFSRILNSGSAMLAISYGKAVLVPRIGALEDLGELLGPGWVWYCDANDPLRDVQRVLSEAGSSTRSVRHVLERVSADAGCAALRSAYQSLVRGASS